MRGNLRRRLNAIALAGLAGAAVMSLVLYVILPAAARRLTAPQIGWLREMFTSHTGLSMLALSVAVALLGLPIFLVTLWATRLSPSRR
jgi:hypothetical protein